MVFETSCATFFAFQKIISIKLNCHSTKRLRILKLTNHSGLQRKVVAFSLTQHENTLTKNLKYAEHIGLKIASLTIGKLPSERKLGPSCVT